MTLLLGRNLKLFFRDRSAVFFSLLAVFIVIGLYALFLGDVWLSSFENIKDARAIMDSWIIAGLLSVSSVTTTMGAFGIMIDDRKLKIDKDFFSSPVKRSGITGGYVLSAYTISVIMCAFTYIIGKIYLASRGVPQISLNDECKIAGLILLSSLSNTSLVFFLISFIKSNNAFSTASSIIGTLIGFLTGIYLPIGSLPEGVQMVIKLFPPSHAAALFRQVLMEAPMAGMTEAVGAEFVSEFNEMMGVSYKIGDFTFTPLMSILILAATAVVFFALSVLNVGRKKR